MENSSKGIVKFYNDVKGYGFIVGEDGSDVFFHVSEVLEKVAKDDIVYYTMKDSKKGPLASQVKRA